MDSTYLARHGRASFGTDSYDVLSPTGIRQAEILGDHLLNLDVRFDRVLSGNLRRQRHTVRATFERLEPSGLVTPELEVDPAFNEFEADAVIRTHLPDLLEEQPEALYILRHAAEHRVEFQRLFSTIIARWVSSNHEKDRLESWQEFLDKVHDGPHHLLAQASGKGKVAVFTSGSTITALLQLIISVPSLKAFKLNWQIVNTSLTRLRFRDEEASLASFNSHVHLELLKAPELITYRWAGLPRPFRSPKKLQKKGIGPVTTVADTVPTIKGELSASATASLDLVFQFDIEDSNNHYLVIKGGTYEVVQGDARNPNVTLIMDSEILRGITSGKTDSMQAFMADKLRVEGDMMLAMKLGELFPV